MRSSLFIILIISCFSSSGQQLIGRVSKVIDGDTFIFTTDSASNRVRLQGIDAPELHQFFGQESKHFLEQFTNIKGMLILSGVDKYGRKIASLYIDTINVGILSLRLGFSWWYYYYEKRRSYYEAELYAKQHGLGLWHYPNPIAPWEWRKHIKE